MILRLLTNATAAQRCARVECLVDEIFYHFTLEPSLDEGRASSSIADDSAACLRSMLRLKRMLNPLDTSTRPYIVSPISPAAAVLCAISIMGGICSLLTAVKICSIRAWKVSRSESDRSIPTSMAPSREKDMTDFEDPAPAEQDT